MAHILPAELWITIFNYVVDDDSLLLSPMPNALSESAWVKSFFGDWSLLGPWEALHLRQRRRMYDLVSISTTCKNWRNLSTDAFYRILHFDGVANAQSLCNTFDRNRRLARLSLRLHVGRSGLGRRPTTEDIEYCLVPILRHCTKLQQIILEPPLGNSFGVIADTICTYCPKSVRTLHLRIGDDGLATLIRMLELLPRLESIHIDFDGDSTESVALGSASGLVLTFKKLQRLSVRGYFTDFLEQAASWEFPSLEFATLNCRHWTVDLPDFMAFLDAHGERLTYLDITTLRADVDVALVLSKCPKLTTFCFNPDWYLPRDAATDGIMTRLVFQPHPRITTIGCHSLGYALGVGPGVNMEPTNKRMLREQNDANFAAINKRNFPELQRVRCVSTMLLRDLDAADGPGDGCLERWERWWDQCADEDVRLEDCTGDLLGNLPQKASSQAGTSKLPVVNPKDTIGLLQDLVLECREWNRMAQGIANTVASLRR